MQQRRDAPLFSNSVYAGAQYVDQEVDEYEAFLALEEAAAGANAQHVSISSSDEDEEDEEMTVGNQKLLSTHQSLESVQLASRIVLPGVSIPYEPPQTITEEPEQQPPLINLNAQRNLKFDQHWGTIYLGLLSTLFATSLITYLKSGPQIPGKDTVYSMLRDSSGMLFTELCIAITISVCWIWVMTRTKFMKTLMYATVVGVPFGSLGIMINALVMSYRSGYGGNTFQDQAMRWTSLFVFCLSIVWLFVIYKNRRIMDRSLRVVEVACAIMDGRKWGLILGVVIGFSVATWIWVGMIMKLSGWGLGMLYSLMYVWSWGVVSGIQREITINVVLDWYNEERSGSKRFELIDDRHFGTICYSSLLRLLIRLPLMILPKRLVGLLQLFIYNFLSLDKLSHPLTLTYAIIHDQDLSSASRRLVINHRSLQVYRMAKFLLLAARALTSVGLGFAAWIRADDNSLFGYVAGLIGGFMGWYVFGATEGSLGIIIDGMYVCKESEFLP